MDSQLNAKIADLELGGDEIEPDPTGGSSPRSSSVGSGSFLSDGGGAGRNSVRAARRNKKGNTDAFLCIWQAPEVSSLPGMHWSI